MLHYNPAVKALECYNHSTPKPTKISTGTERDGKEVKYISCTKCYQTVLFTKELEQKLASAIASQLAEEEKNKAWHKKMAEEPVKPPPVGELVATIDK